MSSKFVGAGFKPVLLFWFLLSLLRLDDSYNFDIGIFDRNFRHSDSCSSDTGYNGSHSSGQEFFIKNKIGHIKKATLET